ncbi:MAG: dihydropteroate synthase [Frankiales bacterium]|jgi:dihydropteroate synthase|nr:dihydropteroate synthase [Frankiales bacterium]
MGVLNVTPDSFSDGGDHATVDTAIVFGLRLRALGADLVDVGGESTRPGAQRVSLDEEHARVVPVIEALAQEGVCCSVDTMRAAVAEAAVTAGATLVNDVSGGLADPAMLPTVAALGVPYVAMHWRGHAADMQSRASYDDVVTEVCAELSQRLDACAAAGVADVVVDPGIGFAKTAEHNWQLLRHVDRLQALGPVLLGSSRKAFLGTLLDGRPPVGRDAATTALTVVAAQAGCWGVRVHDVQGSADAVRVWEQLRG